MGLVCMAAINSPAKLYPLDTVQRQGKTKAIGKSRVKTCCTGLGANAAGILPVAVGMRYWGGVLSCSNIGRYGGLFFEIDYCSCVETSCRRMRGAI